MIQSKALKTTLIIDDDLDIRVLLAKFLQNQGHEIMEAQTINEALELAVHNPPHLVLVDIKLENNEYGFTFMQKLRKLDPMQSIPIVVMSSLSNDKAKETAKKFGAQAYLTKPISNIDLQKVLKKIEHKLEYPTHYFIPLDDEDNHSCCPPKNPQLYLKAQMSGDIVKINEISCTLRSKLKFQPEERIVIEAKIFDKLGINGENIHVSKPSRDVEPGIYDTKIQLLGLPENVLKKIRTLNTKKD